MTKFEKKELKLIYYIVSLKIRQKLIKVNKDRPTSSGFKEIPKVRPEKEKEKSVYVTPDEVVKVVDNYRKEDKKKEKMVTKEDLDLYHKVNQVCSSRLPEVKKEKISDDEKIRQESEELIRGNVEHFEMIKKVYLTFFYESNLTYGNWFEADYGDSNTFRL
ncbi:hypothetical protein C1646_667131 [Rhizophagus diaphanus]|nr:hypothetical protein C1646_667131 [Rhizophagus diaphanus] [Rhizophagus sp. MUCL 43196]